MSICLHYGLMEIGVTHVAPIDEEEAMSPLFTCAFGHTHAALYTSNGRIHLDRQQLLPQFLSEQMLYALTQGRLLDIDQLYLIMI